MTLRRERPNLWEIWQSLPASDRAEFDGFRDFVECTDEEMADAMYRERDAGR